MKCEYVTQPQPLKTKKIIPMERTLLFLALIGIVFALEKNIPSQILVTHVNIWDGSSSKTIDVKFLKSNDNLSLVIKDGKVFNNSLKE